MIEAVRYSPKAISLKVAEDFSASSSKQSEVTNLTQRNIENLLHASQRARIAIDAGQVIQLSLRTIPLTGAAVFTITGK